MYRFTPHILILFVLFTHSFMMVDTNLRSPNNLPASTQETATVDTIIVLDSVKNTCIDTCGHCSHHLSHSLALLLSDSIPFYYKQTVLSPLLKVSLLSYTQAPPINPPKT